MNRSYPTKPNTEPYTPQAIAAMNNMPLSYLKSLSDKYAIQIDITIKTDGVKITCIKKNEDKSICKRTIECDNNELGIITNKLGLAIQETINESMMHSNHMMMR